VIPEHLLDHLRSRWALLKAWAAGGKTEAELILLELFWLQLQVQRSPGASSIDLSHFDFSQQALELQRLRRAGGGIHSIHSKCRTLEAAVWREALTRSRTYS